MRHEGGREGCDCRMDLLHKRPGKEALLEVEGTKMSTKHLADRYKSEFSCVSVTISVCPIAFI